MISFGFYFLWYYNIITKQILLTQRILSFCLFSLSLARLLVCFLYLLFTFRSVFIFTILLHCSSIYEFDTLLFDMIIDYLTSIFRYYFDIYLYINSFIQYHVVDMFYYSFRIQFVRFFLFFLFYCIYIFFLVCITIIILSNGS